MTIYEEKELSVINGWLIIFCMLSTLIFSVFFLSEKIVIPLIILNFLLSKGFFILHPNESLVAQFFGEYVGSASNVGFFWMNPLNNSDRISLKIDNHNTEKIKVNDKSGNPIEISVVITWKVDDTAKAMFGVENYKSFLNIQSEAAIRKIASLYSYDSDVEHSLRKNIDEVSKSLKDCVQKFAAIAGITILDAKISNLSYSSEIAQSMLRRQQAEAVVLARKKIVEGAVLMVDEAIHSLEEKELAEFDNEAKVQLITNLMTVLVSENETNQVIQLGKGNS